MSQSKFLQQLSEKFQYGALEPTWGWGFRVAFSVTIPLLLGALWGFDAGGEWMAIAAECISFVELKGTIGHRIRILLSAAVLSILFCIAGSLLGHYIIISLIGMFLVGFLSGLFKNLGDRGMGLALSVYIFYIITCAHPVKDADALWQRTAWVSAGAVWTVLVGIASFVFIRVGTPYRRTIASIWKAVAELAQSAGKGWDGTTTKSSIRQIYLKEKAVRSAIDTSLNLFTDTIDQVKQTDKNKYTLAQVRKSTSLVSLLIIQMSDLVEELFKKNSDKQLGVNLFSLFRAIEQIGQRMELYMLTTKEEERVLVLSRLERLRNIMTVIADLSIVQSSGLQNGIAKLTVYTDRVASLVERTLELMAQQKEQRVFSVYSFTHTLTILHPKYLKSNIKQIFNPDSNTTKYAVRIGIAAFLGMFIGYILTDETGWAKVIHDYFNLSFINLKDHAYWIPFTAIVVSQPYAGATLKKGLERSIGTVAGIVVGSLILMLPFPLLGRFLLVFISSVLLIFFLKRQYSIATFFITLMLIGILSIHPQYEKELMVVRIVCTLIGSIIAITAGFLLLPAWDKHQLPKYLAGSFMANYNYFKQTFYIHNHAHSWTKYKRAAESQNANAFDSFTRFKNEPVSGKRKYYAFYYYLITHNVRITRELNNFHSERELEANIIPIKEQHDFQNLIANCNEYFLRIIAQLKENGNEHLEPLLQNMDNAHDVVPIAPSQAQMIYMEKMLIELKSIYANMQKDTSWQDTQ
jgi:uncharacterized membrane protein YgaE (UPF0421/DUF939 family)